MIPSREELSAHATRLLTLIDEGTTDLADDVLRVPVERYRDPDWFEREVEEIFRRRPVPVAFTAEVAEAGTYLSLDIVGVPLLIVHGADGQVRVFVNACRHRGSRVVERGCGRSTRFTCPYHAWSYDDQGRLTRVPGERLFGDVDREDHGLTELPSEQRHGMVFAVLRPDAELDLDRWLGDFSPELERLALGSRHVAWSNSLAGPNWKICADGYTENYHFPFLHPSTIAVNNLSNVMAHDSWEQFQRIMMPRRSINELREAETEMSAHDIAAHWATVHYVFPNTMLSSSWGDWTFVSQIWPGPEPGVSVTRQIMLASEPLETDEQRTIAASQREAFYAIINGDDYEVGRSIQAGLASRGNSHFTFGRNEIGAQHFHRWVDTMVSRPVAIR